ncbi:MAG: amidohydrolase family protein [Balneolaceae bacterium]|nr:amidohydrolase family protein [Balneolaceae bacterium]
MRTYKLPPDHKSNSEAMKEQSISGISNQFKTAALPIIILLPLILLLTGCDTGRTTVIRNISVIDAADNLRPGMDVVIRGDTISAVAQAGELEIPAGAEVIEGADQYLIPGLWDAHVHFSYNMDLSESMFPLFLANGITSLRDTGGHLHLVMPFKEQSVNNPETIPRLMIAGPLLDGVPRVYDGGPGRPNLAIGAATPREGTQIVDSLVHAGVDFIKSYEMLTPETFEAVIDRATMHRMKVTGHVPLSMDVVDASNQGLDSMEHLRNLEMACSALWKSLLHERRKLLDDGRSEMRGGQLRSIIHSAQRIRAIESQDAERCREVMAVLAENDTWQIPTIALVASGENRHYDRESWRSHFRYLPESVRSDWEKEAAERSEQSSAESSLTFAEWAYGMIGKLNEAGVEIMAGTDTPIALLTPGYSLHEELKLLVKSGLTPLEALEAATLRPAQYFGLEDELGRIATGMKADLVLLDANPLEEIGNTGSIRAVVKNGRLHNRAALDRLLERAGETEE